MASSTHPLPRLRPQVELADAMRALETALSVPAGTSPPHGPEAVETAARRLESEFRDHAAFTEGPDGLYTEARTVEPRLGGCVRRLLCEHAAIGRDLADLTAAARTAAARRVRERTAGSEAGALQEGAPLTLAGRSVLAALTRHLRRGSDLMHELYERDLGVSD